jgi:hypothetical protein
MSENDGHVQQQHGEEQRRQRPCEPERAAREEMVFAVLVDHAQREDRQHREPDQKRRQHNAFSQDGGHRDQRHGADQQQDLKYGDAGHPRFPARTGDDAQCQQPEQGGARHDDEEGQPPAVERGEHAADRRADDGGDAPHRRDQREGTAPQFARKDHADHRVAHRRQQAGAQPLDGAAGEHHRHVRRKSAYEAAESEAERRHQIDAARAEVERSHGRKDRGDDRRHHEYRGVPGEELEPADLPHHRGQEGGDDEGLHRLQADARGEGDRREATPVPEHRAPGIVGRNVRRRHVVLAIQIVAHALQPQVHLR